MRAFPVPDEEVFNKTMRKAINIASSSKKLPEDKSELKQLYTNDVAPILKPILGSDEKTEQVLNGLVEARTTPWIRYFYNYNPADEYAKIKTPVLSLNGTKDTQVPAKIHQVGIRKALEKANNKNFKIIELEGLNHLFQEAETGEMNEYSTIDQTFSPQALEIISNWILVQIK
jgi:pimeloyl-ACP methyl ester carboxylesterase